MENFLKNLCDQKTDELLLDFARKRVLHRIPHIFIGNEDGYYEFRKRISEFFGNVPYNQIHICGSANLGFSPLKRKLFDFDSDIDVAIVSSELYDAIMKEIRELQYSYRNNDKLFTEYELKQYHSFLEYTAIGWIRPDKLPTALQIGKMKDLWFQFFNDLSYGKSEVGNYEVRAGLYKTYEDLEIYTLDGLKKIRSEMEAENVKQ